jgi:hypothetical protein
MGAWVLVAAGSCVCGERTGNVRAFRSKASPCLLSSQICFNQTVFEFATCMCELGYLHGVPQLFGSPREGSSACAACVGCACQRGAAIVVHRVF